MSIPEWDISNRNLRLNLTVFAESSAGVGHSNSGVRKRRATDAAEKINRQMQKIAQSEPGSDGSGRGKLSCLGALTVAEVDSISLAVASSQRSRDAAVHSSGEADDRARTGWGGVVHLFKFYERPLSHSETRSE